MREKKRFRKKRVYLESFDHFKNKLDGNWKRDPVRPNFMTHIGFYRSERPINEITCALEIGNKLTFRMLSRHRDITI